MWYGNKEGTETAFRICRLLLKNHGNPSKMKRDWDLMKAKETLTLAVMSCILLVSCGEDSVLATPSSSSIPVEKAEEAEVHFQLGMDLYNQEDQEGALTEFTKAIELNPQYGEAYHWRGNLYQDMFEFESAVEDYSTAIPLYEDGEEKAWIYLERGFTYSAMRNAEQALIDYDRAIEIWPTFTQAYVYRGSIYRINGMWDLAIADYTKLVELNPDEWMYVEWLAGLYAESGDIEQAIEQYEKAIEMIDDPEKREGVEMELEELLGSTKNTDG